MQYAINEWRMKKGTFKISKKTTKGNTYYTAAIVKSYRENGKVKQKTIKSFDGLHGVKVKLITLTDEDGKVIARKVTKNVDEKAKDGLKIFGMTVIKAKKMYWRK